MNTRDFLGLVTAGVVVPGAWAQKRDAPVPGAASGVPAKPVLAAAPQSAPSSNGPFVVAVNEGVTYRDPSGSSDDRFGELAADLQKLVKRPVEFQLVRQYPELVEGLR